MYSLRMIYKPAATVFGPCAGDVESENEDGNDDDHSQRASNANVEDRLRFRGTCLTLANIYRQYIVTKTRQWLRVQQRNRPKLRS